MNAIVTDNIACGHAASLSQHKLPGLAISTVSTSETRGIMRLTIDGDGGCLSPGRAQEVLM